MIIGISGKIHSGKDTVGKMIQYFTFSSAGVTFTLNQWIAITNTNNVKNQFIPAFQIQKFADALKNIVCILIGCTREQLEDEDFKNSHLSYEWGRIIKGEATTYTVREVLQIVGTDLLRIQFHKDTWINALFSKYKQEFKYNPWYIGKGIYDVTENDEIQHPPMYPKWIITDVRFPNEADTIRANGGLLIRINRSGNYLKNHDYSTLDKIDLENTAKQVVKAEHPSETALDNYHFDYTIENTSSIEDLATDVYIVLKKENII
jgi:hypothetical protein